MCIFVVSLSFIVVSMLAAAGTENLLFSFSFFFVDKKNTSPTLPCADSMETRAAAVWARAGGHAGPGGAQAEAGGRKVTLRGGVQKLAPRSPFGREDRLEAAGEREQATQFKLAKMYEDAMACYQMQAGARTRMSEDMQACNALTSAFEMYAKSDAIEEGYEAASTAIEKYKDAGKFDRAAKLLQKVAEVSVSSQPRWRKIPSLGRTARSRHRRAVARNAQPMFPRPVSSLSFPPPLTTSALSQHVARSPD